MGFCLVICPSALVLEDLFLKQYRLNMEPNDISQISIVTAVIILSTLGHFVKIIIPLHKTAVLPSKPRRAKKGPRLMRFLPSAQLLVEVLYYIILRLRSQPTIPIPILPNRSAPGAGMKVVSCEPGLILQVSSASPYTSKWAQSKPSTVTE